MWSGFCSQVSAKNDLSDTGAIRSAKAAPLSITALFLQHFRTAAVCRRPRQERSDLSSTLVSRSECGVTVNRAAMGSRAWN